MTTTAGSTVPIFDGPFLCFGGRNHQWRLTGDSRKTWVSGGSENEPPKDAPVMYEQRCFCGATKWAY
jgi:hypothetical protein